MRIRQLLLLQLCTAWYVGKCDEGREMGASSNAAHRCLRLAAPQATVAASEALPPADVAVARALWDATVQFRPGPEWDAQDPSLGATTGSECGAATCHNGDCDGLEMSREVVGWAMA